MHRVIRRSLSLSPTLPKMSAPTSNPITKFPISSLPLPPRSHTLTSNLTPDPYTESVPDFRTVQQEKPSIQRRARLLAPAAHFSYVSPCPVGFPYDIVPEKGEDVVDKQAFIERWLSDREALVGRGLGRSAASSSESVYVVNGKTDGQARVDGGVESSLKVWYPKEGKRDQKLELIGLSETGLRDCLPHLHVGDAFDILGDPTLSKADSDGVDTVSRSLTESSGEDVAIRKELVDVLSGHAALMSGEGENPLWAPWSLRYSGHQFGVWAAYLHLAGCLVSTPHPERPDELVELQLKGAGRTPFSRSADGLAVVRSSIREFLAAEAMHALGIPTSRSLALISLPETPVIREQLESACVLTRLAPSFIRIGNFEALNPPANMFFLGGGQQSGDLDALRILGEWVGRRVLNLDLKWGEEGESGEPWGKKLVLEVARRNARMVAGWQAYGFMHGVINTDNVSILGLTIDYGPYAFMDVFNQRHICNHSDSEGRYAYNQQPSMILYALRSLLTSLAPLIGAEAELGKAVSKGWAEDIPEAKLSEWRTKGGALVKAEMESLILEVSAQEYGRLMRKRLGLRRHDKEDESTLSRPLLNLMSEHRLDFHTTFRRLSFFRPSLTNPSESSALDEYIQTLLELTPQPENLEKDKATKDWRKWLTDYAQRIESERAEWCSGEDTPQDHFDDSRQKEQLSANPRFVLRQWVLEDVIKAVEKEPRSGKRILRKVLQMACKPFDAWGAEGVDDSKVCLDDETKEERRYCGIGEKRMLGFQCSCSS